MNLDWGWIIIGCILAAVGVSVWVWFRWDRLSALDDRPEPLDPYGKLPPEVEKRRAPE